VDLELVAEPFGADDALAQPCPGHILSGEDLREITDTRPVVPHVSEEARRLAFDGELGLAAAGVAEGVAGNLGDGGGEACLVLLWKTKQPRDVARPLPGGHNILFKPDVNGQKGGFHGRPPATWRFAINTVTSSRTRRKSR
jgi:hypothetical protein